ncbi:50S ribosomal protein L28 [bacterium]|nr:50S ribosomal protein L28 [candidate division CSSED10-310 bacterium]
MSRKCEICGKGPQFGNRISHAHNLSKRRFNPNIHKIKVVVDGVQKRMNVCTSCLSAGKIRKA